MTSVSSKRLAVSGALRWFIPAYCLLLTAHVWAYTPGKFYYEGHTKEKIIGLTFDDGPGKFTIPVLELLKQHHIHATFFMEGSQIEGYPKIAKQVVDAGHEVGNHTYIHFDYHKAKNAAPQRLAHELAQTESALQRAAGIHTDVVRMPYGYYNHKWLMPTLKEHGYALVHWTFGEDWKFSIPKEKMIRDYEAAARPGAIFLFHDGGKNREKTLEVVTVVINDLEKKGYRFVPAKELLKD